ncbi:MAG: ADP-ribosylglycohydrolase family protein [Erysipelotrichales bacterium]|nr:ADP-ribosylglycohydrolase family protein [Erysipelotrichales bacterium]
MIGVIGAIAGDIIGSSYENTKYRTKDYNFKLITERSRITDDSIHTFAIMDWLMNTDRSIHACKQMLLKWSRLYPFAGYGPMMVKWIAGANNWAPYDSFGNGSAMRVSPVAWAANCLDHALDLAIMSAIPTHNHSEGIKGAQAIAACIYLNRIGESKKTIKEYIKNKFKYDLSLSYEDIYKDHEFNCICQYSVPRSIIVWLNSDSYEDCIRKAVSLGGDCDTEACIAGSICNANIDTSISDSLINEIIENGCGLNNHIIDLINKFRDIFEIHNESKVGLDNIQNRLNI